MPPAICPIKIGISPSQRKQSCWAVVHRMMIIGRTDPKDRLQALLPCVITERHRMEADHV